MTQGNRARKKQRKKYMNDIKEMVERDRIEEVVEWSRTRGLWHSIVTNVKLTRYFAVTYNH